ncbi:hypothetical protein BH23ACT10_BH23ACT10_13010 [soil metagenome]
MRTLGLLGAAALAFAVLVGAEIIVARNRAFLVDVPFTVDRTVGLASDGREPLELRVLGDSTAAGVGTDAADKALPSLIAERVARRTGRAVHVVGHGVSGARTADVTTEQLPKVDGADVIVIAIGSNDVIHLSRPGRLRRQTAELLTEATAAGVPVVLGGIPRFYGVGALAQPLRAMTDGYAAVLRDVQRDVAQSAEGVTFVDIAALASPRFLGVPESMSSDEFHPATVGYGFWADALAPAVEAAVRT